MEIKTGITPFRISGFNENNGRFEFEIEASNNNLDSYFTHFTERSLRNFAIDAREGVQFLDSHNSNNLGYGRTFNGRLQRPSDREPVFEVPEGVELAINPPNRFARSQLNVFTVPGINFGGGLTFASTDDFIRAVENEIAVDVSVGFSANNWRCDICGNNYLRYSDCQHFAGMSYAAGENGDRLVLATVTIDHARLREVSSVYDGATPGAMIRKANEGIRSGEISKDEKTFLEIRYKSELANLWQIPVDSVPEVDDIVLEAERDVQDVLENENMEFENEVRELLKESTVDSDLEPLEQIRELISQNGRLVVDAETGKRYKADLIESAIAAGIRAYGDKFDQERYRGILEKGSVDEIQAMEADWERTAKQKFPNERKTKDELEKREETEVQTPVLPASFYK